MQQQSADLECINPALTSDTGCAGRKGGTERPLLSSIVQMRGSVPLYWSQAPGIVNVKPVIQLQHFDPLYEATGLHFDDLSERYANPVVVLNLVKKSEKVPHESLLGAEFKRAIMLLNAQRPPEKAIDYIAWDFTQARSLSLLAGQRTGVPYCMRSRNRSQNVNVAKK